MDWMEKISDWKCILIQRLKFFLNEISLIEKCSFYTEIGVFLFTWNLFIEKNGVEI